MNTMMFLAGLGVGTGFAGLLFLVVLGIVAKDLGKKSGNKEHMQVTEDLLRERNKHNKEIAASLQELVNWANNNWNLNR